MKIAGLIKNSFVDYPGLISAVIFTQGCNYDCFFCHNRDLISHGGEQMDEETVIDFLQKRKGLLDAVVISGGEPTLHRDLMDFIIKVKELGYLIKLDTNGSRPEVLLELTQAELIDYIAIDYKAPFYRYDEICCSKCETDAVKKSIETAVASNALVELRTTFVPQLSADDIDIMLSEVSGADIFSIQQYIAPENYKKEHEYLVKTDPHSDKEIKKAKKIAKNHIKRINIR